MSSVHFSGEDNAGSQVGYNYGSISNDFRKITINHATPTDPGPVAGSTGGSRIVFPQSALRPVKGYVERPALSARLRQQLRQEEGEPLLQDARVVVVHGLGGAGKSQLVLDYVHANQNEYAAMFWVSSDSQVSVQRDFRRMYKLLYNKLGCPDTDLPKDDDLAFAVKDWFFASSGRRIIIFDSADNILDEQAETDFDIMAFCPNAPGLDVVITTRIAAAKDLATTEAIEVGEMTTDEAAELFCRKAELKASPDTWNVTAILEELGHLALPITLAGSYVKTSRLASNLGRYLEEYREQRRRLLDWKPSTLKHQYGKSVQATWETSYKAIVSRNQAAARFLSLLAFLDFEDIYIPLFLVSAKASGNMQDSRVDTLPAILGSAVGCLKMHDLNEIITLLEDFSLIYKSRPEHLGSQLSGTSWYDNHSFHMHKLVHAWCFERQCQEDQFEFGLAALELLKLAMGTEHPRDTDLASRLRLFPHVRRNAELLSEIKRLSKAQSSRLVKILWQPTNYLHQMGKYSEERQLRELHVRSCIMTLGEDDAQTLSAKNGLANTLRDLGKNNEAVCLLRQVLQAKETLFSNDLDYILVSKNDLAIALGGAGEHREAIALQRELLELKRKTLGEEHRDTMVAMGNLSYSYSVMGDFKRAVELDRQTLQHHQSRFGRDHLDTAVSMSQLAGSLGHLGHSSEAAGLSEQSVAIRKKLLGEDHPSTLTAMCTYARQLTTIGQYQTAARQEEIAVKGLTKAMTAAHPATLCAKSNYAYTLLKWGRTAEALRSVKELVPLSEQVYGERHPSHLRLLHNLAIVLDEHDQAQEAEHILRAALVLTKEAFDDKHPEYLARLHSLAANLAKQQKHDEALKLSETLVETQKEVRGPEHTETHRSMALMAGVFFAIDRKCEAVNTKRYVLDVKRKVLGDSHPETLYSEFELAKVLIFTGYLETAAAMLEKLVQKSSRDKLPDALVHKAGLGLCLQRMGLLERAAQMQTESVKKFSEQFGAEQPWTLVQRHGLALTWYLMGKYDESEKLQIEVLEARERVLGPQAASTLSSMAFLGQVLRATRKLSEAKSILEETLHQSDQNLSPNHPVTSRVLKTLRTVLWEQGDLVAAEAHERRYLASLKSFLGKEPEDFISAARKFTDGLTRVLTRQCEAELLQQNLPMIPPRSDQPLDDPCLLIIDRLAYLLSARLRHPQSEALARQVYDMRSNDRDLLHLSIAMSAEQIRDALLHGNRKMEAEEMEESVLDGFALYGKQHDIWQTAARQYVFRLETCYGKPEKGAEFLWDILASGRVDLGEPWAQEEQKLADARRMSG